MTSEISILRIFRKKIDNFSNFSGTFRSFRSFENFSSNSLCRCDFFAPNFIKIRAILAIFRPLEDFRFSRRALSVTRVNYWELPLKIFLDVSGVFFRAFVQSARFWSTFSGAAGKLRRRPLKGWMRNATEHFALSCAERFRNFDN